MSSSSSIAPGYLPARGRHDARTMPVPCHSRGGLVQSVWPRRSSAYGKKGLSQWEGCAESPEGGLLVGVLRVQGPLFAHPLGVPHRVADTAYRADGLRALRKAAELR